MYKKSAGNKGRNSVKMPGRSSGLLVSSLYDKVVHSCENRKVELLYIRTFNEQVIIYSWPIVGGPQG